MSKPTGGPAFPGEFVKHPIGEVGNKVEIKEMGAGMTLRDYFAAKALPGILAPIMSDECHRWLPADFAREAYAIADAMLAARNKGE